MKRIDFAVTVYISIIYTRRSINVKDCFLFPLGVVFNPIIYKGEMIRAVSRVQSDGRNRDGYQPAGN